MELYAPNKDNKHARPKIQLHTEYKSSSTSKVSTRTIRLDRSSPLPLNTIMNMDMDVEPEVATSGVTSEPEDIMDAAYVHDLALRSGLEDGPRRRRTAGVRHCFCQYD